MTHRVHPYIFRIGRTTNWKSRWFDMKNFAGNLREDTLLREWLQKRLRSAHVEQIEIERSPNVMHVIVKTSRPGILIGRGGTGAEDLKNQIKKKLFEVRKRFKTSVKPHDIRLTIEEVRMPETHAAIAAQMIVDEIEKRISFRRILKQSVEKISASRDVKGVKVALKGRLDGAEMARYEKLRKGRIPLQTIRANVDYAERTAYTTYGTIGVKVWIYKGDVFDKDEKQSVA
ncbi:MAG: 30S ribosomal protein S3 [Candidatus Sungbacteria bacterium RIFCSPHIGHO2_01_FULL_50_25]|uniref:Small ribosomal subunit protein uS3 n=1 Tax=Candidatus Sungbacteria bacterium RIFCSPHIGHO2_01_FULL_50_25 TaxID=1802265 RepID=A0A1G2K846_9BACT|nr:MAG: 30S ribosomal protein S3 [Candidatus Sungbacteria bacterium RIFCSPHIGHO2_01_FULL_50_25]